MQRLLGAVLVVVIAAGGAAAAQGRGNGGGKEKTREQTVDHADHGGGVSVAAEITFGRAEVDVLRTHYAPRYKSLPPGLQKKLARTGTLPPGWQKKLEPFPAAFEQRFPALPSGYIRGVYDGNAVIVNLRSGVLLDVAVLF